LTTALQSYATKAYVDGLTFVGTQAQWNALTTAQKKAYKYASFTDDYTDNPVGNLNALTTTDKSSCVGAINELKSGLINLIGEIDFTFPSDSTSTTVSYPTGHGRDNTAIIAIYFYRNNARYFNQHCFSIALTASEISISLQTGYDYIQGCNCKLYYV
jgi:hypothetical protein